MNANDLELVLDSLDLMGVYVVREDNHEILYFNSIVAKVVPGAKTGMVCHELWQGSCERCPLIGIEGKNKNQSFNYDGPFGRATDITATRVTWDGGIPAFVICFSPHAETYNSTYSKIVKGNITHDTCEAVKMEKGERELLPKESFTLTQALQTFAHSETLFDEDTARFLNFSSLRNMGEELKKGKKILVCNYRRLTPDGYHWNTMEVVPDINYTDDDQSVMIYVKDVQDIYREGLEHESLKMKNEAILKALGRENFGVYIVSLPDGRMENVRVAQEDCDIINDSVTRWDEAMESLIKARYHPDYRERFRNMFSLKALYEACRRGQKRQEMFALRSIDGQYRYVNAGVRFHKDVNGKDYAVLAFQNVDQYVRAELEHMEAEREKAHIISSLSTMFFSIGYIDLKKGTMRRIVSRDAVEKILGDSLDYTQIMKSYADFFVAGEDRDEYLAAVGYDTIMDRLSPDSPILAYEYREMGGKADGEFWVRASVVLAQMEEGKPSSALYVAQDITQSKEKEMRDRQTLQDALETANFANAAKSEFLSRMSHDIRTPMNAIIGMTAIAGTHLDDRERVADCLGKITVSGRHLLALINEVLDLSKIESGRMELAEEEFELSDFIDEVTAIILPNAHAKKQNLEFRLYDVRHEKVVGDMLRLQQVFTNILSNAVKYTHAGGHIEVEIRETLSAVSGYGHYEFVFRDNGIGMSQEYVKHLFEPFSRGDSSRAGQTGGTGLGMAIARNIVQMMNGDITVKTKEGEGTEFTVSLFLKHCNADETSVAELEDLPVLVADDDEISCETACHLLDELGMRGEWVLSGQEAYDKAVSAHENHHDYFAVILDWQMPGMDGVETARKIRQVLGPDIPIIILSAYDWGEVEEEARKAGVSGFVSKPLFKSRLLYLFRQFAGNGADEMSDTQSALASIEGQDYSGRRVLLAEDNDLNREIATEIIGMTGVEIECAVNGKEAVEMFSNSPPGYYDLIFMDIRMPVMDGHEATKIIRGMNRDDAGRIPIIAMSANAFSSDIVASKQAGMNEHIIKPLNFKALSKCMDRWLNVKQ